MVNSWCRVRETLSRKNKFNSTLTPRPCVFVVGTRTNLASENVIPLSHYTGRLRLPHGEANGVTDVTSCFYRAVDLACGLSTGVGRPCLRLNSKQTVITHSTLLIQDQMFDHTILTIFIFNFQITIILYW